MMPTENQLKSLTNAGKVIKHNAIQSPKESPKKLKSNPCRFCSGTITSLLPTDVPRICSHQQADDHRKREYHTTDHTTIKVG